MDRFSFRAAVHIAQAEFRQWLRSSRIIILFVMLVFVNVQVIGPLRQCKMLMGEMLSIPEAFVALGNSGVILLIIPILFLVLMADFHRGRELTGFIRCAVQRGHGYLDRQFLRQQHPVLCFYSFWCHRAFL